VNDAFESLWKEAAMAWFVVQPRRLVKRLRKITKRLSG
jgi:hypothetical protein